MPSRGNAALGAIEFVGRAMSVEQVMREVIPDHSFYATSGGGMTISGGEPLLQLDFTLVLLHAAWEVGIRRCVETSGFARRERLLSLIPHVNLFLYDCKGTDPRRHEEFTGQPNRIILENPQALVAAGAEVQLQCPIVPGLNEREDHFAGIARPAASLPQLRGVRVLPYHPLGESKLQRFGRSPTAQLPREPFDPARLESWSNWLRNRGVRVLNDLATMAVTPLR